MRRTSSRRPGWVDALRAWIPLGKLIPLAWSHSAKAEDIIGHIDPASAKAIDGEVHAAGWIDQGTERGKDAWRLVKSGTLGFSFGYLIVDAVKRDDGVREIHELDVFEVSACSTPMNAATRVTSFKAADREPMSLDELRRFEASLDLDGHEQRRQQAAAEFVAQLRTAMGGTTNGDRGKTLRDRGDKAACEHGPVVISTFAC